MKVKTDDQLIQLIAKGSQKDFVELFNRYTGIFLGYAMSILNEKSLAEDIIQETWMKIVRLAPSYEAKGHFVSWAYTMIRNQAFNLMKSKAHSHKENLDDVVDAELQIESFEQELIIEQNHTLMKEAFYNLPEVQRVCLTLWMNEELSYEEIAQKLGLTLAAVKTHLHRAKETLKKQIQRSGS